MDDKNASNQSDSSECCFSYKFRSFKQCYPSSDTSYDFEQPSKEYNNPHIRQNYTVTCRLFSVRTESMCLQIPQLFMCFKYLLTMGEIANRSFENVVKFILVYTLEQRKQIKTACVNIGRKSKSEIDAATRRTRTFYLLVCCEKYKVKVKQYYNNLGCCLVRSLKLVSRKKKTV